MDSSDKDSDKDLDKWWRNLQVGQQLVARGAETANTGRVVEIKKGGYTVRWFDSTNPDGGEETFISYWDLKSKNVERVE